MEKLTLPEMVYESHLLQKKRSQQAIRNALIAGKIKNAKIEIINGHTSWTAPKQDFLVWLEGLR